MRSVGVIVGRCVNLSPPGPTAPFPKPPTMRATAMVDIKAGQVIDIDVATGCATLATPTV